MMDMSKGFEPQLSKKGAAPKQYDIAIEVTDDDGTVIERTLQVQLTGGVAP